MTDANNPIPWSPTLEKCFSLYVQITATPTHPEMLEYASRYRKLSLLEQGELTHRINAHFHDVEDRQKV